MYYNDYNRINDSREEFSPQVPVPDPAPKKNHSGVKIAALCLTCALVGGIAGGTVTRLLPKHTGATIYEASIPAVVSVANVKTDEPMTMSQIYAANVNSTVGITTELVTTNFWGQRVKGAAAGSGFVISDNGYILTNYHVIEDATSIQVAFSDGTTYPATLVGGEAANDVAVLKIDAEGLTPVVLGDSDSLVVGEQVCAIGNPLGELTFSMTVGYVSAKDRSITFSDGKTINMIQTDTAINSGNSGGALFNSYGQVVGISSAKYSGSSSSSASIEGLGFAIPINDVKSIVTDLIEKGYVTGKPSLGILNKNVSQEAQYYGVPAGTYVEAILKGSAADKAGLKEGDIITAVDGNTVSSTKELSNAITSHKAGETITITVFREGKNVTLNVTLDEQTAERDEAMNKLWDDYTESQQAQQKEQQQSQNSNTFNWSNGGNSGDTEYGSSWPFGAFGW